jgi:TetR/AcrR family transcriptional regulator, transcriptional repressor for nem operon
MPPITRPARAATAGKVARGATTGRLLAASFAQAGCKETAALRVRRHVWRSSVSKGAQTREMILARAAELFSRQGYFGSSLSDIMDETGLEKGGIYNHFRSKEQLALEAFDYAFELVDQRMRHALAGKYNAVERLLAIISYFQELVEDPLLAGGCPILNTAIEADDAHAGLRDRARRAMDNLRTTLRRIIAKGIERHELRPGIDADACATVFIATLEGAVMLSKLYQDTLYMRRAAEHLTEYVETTLRLSRSSESLVND